MAKINKHDRTHYNNLSRYAQQIEAVYLSAVNEAAAIGALVTDFNPDRLFSFSDYPVTRKRIERLLESLRNGLQSVIVNGIQSEWTLANNKNNELCKQVFGKAFGHLTKEQEKRYLSTNETARDAFLQRKTAGLRLSDRVWNYTNQFKDEIELGLDIGIRGGKSADEISRDLRLFLKYPDKLFRRVRDEHGELQLSKNAAAFHPGQGVYRSSYKNARRVAVTECNIAYRTADHLRWQQMDFVVGILIEPSDTNHPVRDICDDLKGRYPKNFKWTGWHPHCRCHATPILKAEDEVAEDNNRIIQGGEVSPDSVNTVTTPPDGFVKWIEENGSRIDEARKHDTLPYFIKDNERKGWFKDSISSRYNEEYIQAMSKQGIIFKIEDLIDIMTNSPYNRLDVVRLNENIQNIFTKQGVTDLKCRMKVSKKGGVHLSWTGSGVELKRDFGIVDGTKVVEHELFDLDKELQGHGVSRKVFKALYEQYRVTGVERIELYANIDIGGYAWARYGFCTTNRNETIGAIRFSNLTRKQEDRIMEIIDGHFNSSNAPFPMNQIARLPYGKKALLGGYWEGVLDLTDTHQRRVFERYLRR